MIPKIVHLSWVSKDILNSSCELARKGVQNLLSLNPDWIFEVSTDQDIESYLKDNLQYRDYELLKNKHIVEKSDVWRLIKLYNEGGIYVDIDRLCDTPFSDFIQEETRCVFLINGDYDFSHDMMISASQNPVYGRALELNLERRRNGWNNVYFLGPQTYMHAATEIITGSIINTNPGKLVFDLLRTSIDQIPNIEYIQETPPFKTCIFRNESQVTIEEIESMKRDLYKEYHLKHWTKEW